MKRQIKSILLFVGLLGALKYYENIRKKTYEIQCLSNKYLELVLLMNKWVRIKQEGREIPSYFKKNKY